MPHIDLPDAAFRKSSYSSDEGACVELANAPAGVIAVRDSKNKPGPKLFFPGYDWKVFADQVKAGSYDL